MTDRLASLFESAVSMLPMSEARSLDLFTEITNYDESACDAWIGRIRCGDTDRVTLFRAWYSRRNFGQLSGSVQISMSTLNARIAIGGLYGDITYPVTSPLAITMGFAACEAAQGNYADAMEALEAAPVAGSEHLVAWMKAVVYGAAERWTDVIDQVKSAGNGRTSFWPARPVWRTGLPRQTWPCSPKPNADSPRPTTRPPVRRVRAPSPGIWRWHGAARATKAPRWRCWNGYRPLTPSPKWLRR